MVKCFRLSEITRRINAVHDKKGLESVVHGEGYFPENAAQKKDLDACRSPFVQC